MHALRYMHAVGGDPIIYCHSLRMIKIVHYARQYGKNISACTAANECFEVQFTHIREESQISSQLHAWKTHDEIRD